jgi:hypothetical protein
LKKDVKKKKLRQFKYKVILYDLKIFKYEWKKVLTTLFCVIFKNVSMVNIREGDGAGASSRLGSVPTDIMMQPHSAPTLQR